MDFKKVFVPYHEEGVERSYNAYLKWLTGPKYNIPKEFVEKALLTVITELHQGKEFVKDDLWSAGHYLDHYIRERAIYFRDEWAKTEEERMQNFFNELVQIHIEEFKKSLEHPSLWKRIKAVFRPL